MFLQPIVWQVSLLWPHLVKNDLEIGFAYQSFNWTNNAKGSAGITCIVVGMRNKSNKPKFLFVDNVISKVENINFYLINSSDTFVEKRTASLSKLPIMKIGNKPIDGGNYLFSFR